MGIRDTSYYDWQNVYGIGNSLSPVVFTGSIMDFVTTASFDALALDPVSGGIYVGGGVNYSGALGAGSSPIPYWHIIRSLDNGTTWSVVDQIVSGSVSDIGIYKDGTIIATGYEYSGSGGGATPVWTTRKSHVTASTSWATVNRVNLSASNTGSSFGKAIAFGISGAIYIGGSYQKEAGGSAGWLVRRSNVSNPSSWVTILDSGSANNPTSIRDVAVRANDMITGGQELWLVGERGTGSGLAAISVMTSSDDVNFKKIFSASTFDEPSIGRAIAIDPNTRDVYFSTLHSIAGTYDRLRIFSANFISNPRPFQANQFGQVWEDTNSRWLDFTKFDLVYSGTLYYTFAAQHTGIGLDRDTRWEMIRCKHTSLSKSSDMENVMLMLGAQFPRGNLTSSEGGALGVRNENGKEVVYVAGMGGLDTGSSFRRFTAITRKGARTANSSTLGPTMLATSVEYVRTEANGFLEKAIKLNNVSEYSHGGGALQMKNIIIGTTDTGKFGKTDDSIIQVKYIGSVVHVLWPKQQDQSIPVKGFGDFSIGQRAGKLTTDFQPGDNQDVTDFDHLALYCYLRKEVSGTLDDVIVSIERKPLTSVGFATEQSIDYAVSGSKVEARLRDIEYKKQIDYGDLSIREIGFPIDIPLINIKEVRLSVRHRVGQTEENKNLIIWGRFIKSDKNRDET